MQRLMIATAAMLLVLSCQREQITPVYRPTTKSPAKPQDLRNAKIRKVLPVQMIETQTQAHLGNAAGPDGIVTMDKDTFKSGEPIVLSLTIPLSPKGLQMGAVWHDAQNKVILDERKNVDKAKVVTFPYTGKKLKPGKYRVVGYWGGNIAAEKTFTVTK